MIFTVTINILTRNRLELLKAALKSVAGQSVKNCEIIVVDDGSDDGTADYLASIHMPLFKVIRHKNSIGITRSRQEALLASKGKYIALLDDDDEWPDPQKLENQLMFFENNPQAVLLGSARFDLLAAGQVSYRSRPLEDSEIRRSMLFKNNFFTSSVMFDRQAALKVGGFREKGGDFAEDYDLWLRLGTVGEMRNFAEAFVKYRVPNYNRSRRVAFLRKQAALVTELGKPYPFYWFALAAWRLRLLLNRLIAV